MKYQPDFEDEGTLSSKTRSKWAAHFDVPATDQYLDRPVEEMLSPKELASELKMSTRNLQFLEDRGLPSAGEGKRKRHPWPLSLAWYFSYRRRIGHGTSGRLSISCRPAWDEYQRNCAMSRAFYSLERDEVADLDPWGALQLENVRTLRAGGWHPAHDYPKGMPV